MRISDWSSDVCSSDLASRLARPTLRRASGAAFGGLHGGPDCRSGTKGQPPLVFPGTGLASGGGQRAQQAVPRSRRVLGGVPRGPPALRQRESENTGRGGGRGGSRWVYPRLIRQDCTLSGSLLGINRKHVVNG